MADEIIRELWRIKDEIAQEHGYNLDALVAHLRRENLRAGRAVVEPDSRRRGFSVGEEKRPFYHPRDHANPDEK